MSYVPRRIREEAERLGISVEEYRERVRQQEAARLAAEEAARLEAALRNAPTNIGVVPVHVPSMKAAAAAGGAGASAKKNASRRVTMSNRRLRVSPNTWTGHLEVHPPAVAPTAEENTRGASYRVRRTHTPVTNFNSYIQRQRRKTLKNVLTSRMSIASKSEKLAQINAALGDLEKRAELNASNAVAIAAIGERLRELMEDD